MKLRSSCPLIASTSDRSGIFVAALGVDVFSESSAVTLLTQNLDGSKCRKKVQAALIELGTQE